MLYLSMLEHLNPLEVCVTSEAIGSMCNIRSHWKHV